MSATNVVVQHVESHGVCTCSFVQQGEGPKVMIAGGFDNFSKEACMNLQT